MANFTDRWPENVSGKFYVDSQCLDCDLCRETAPDTFKRNDERGAFYVYRQPVTDEEIEKALEAVEGCPCESIGADGDTGDWSKPSTVSTTPSPVAEKRTCGCKHGQCATPEKPAAPTEATAAPAPQPVPPKSVRPWWKFWA